jgi:hypothetical protein
MPDIDPTDLDERPTLQEIARQTFAWDDVDPLTDSRIADALTKAGVDPTDEKERERFRRLVAANMVTTDADSIGLSDSHFNAARDALGEDADVEDVRERARLMANQERWQQSEW